MTTAARHTHTLGLKLIPWALAAGVAGAIAAGGGAATAVSPCSFSPSALRASTGTTVSAGRNESAGLTSVSYRPLGGTYAYRTFWCQYFSGNETLKIQVSRPFPKSRFTDKRDQIEQNAPQFDHVTALAENDGFVYLDRTGSKHGSAYVGNEKVELDLGRVSYSLDQVAAILAAVVKNLPR